MTEFLVVPVSCLSFMHYAYQLARIITSSFSEIAGERCPSSFDQSGVPK